MTIGDGISSVGANLDYFEIGGTKAPAGSGGLPLKDSAGPSPAATLRRLRSGARFNNPIESQPYVGSRPWVASTGSWAANLAVTVGQLYQNLQNLFYLCVTSGTTQNSVATVTMTIASPCVVTWTAHGQANGTAVSFTTTGALPTGLAVGTLYFMINVTANTFQLAATPGGAAINTSGSQSGVQTATAGGPSTNSTLPYTDGSAAWMYYGGTPGDLICNNTGQMYQLVTTGTTLFSAQPTGFSASVADGNGVWNIYNTEHQGPVVNIPTGSHNGSYTQAIVISPNAATGNQYAKDGAGPFRFTGGIPFNNPGFGGSTALVASVDLSPAAGNLGGIGTQAGYQCHYAGFEFEFEGTSFELKYAIGNVSMPIPIIVDGRLLDTIFPAYGTFGTYYCIIDFSNMKSVVGSNLQKGEQKHRIKFGIPSSNMVIEQINLLPISAIGYPEMSDNFSVAILGDSIPNTSYSDTTQFNGGLASVYPIILSHLLGLPDMVPVVIGATGMVAPGASQPYIYRIAHLQRLDAFRPLKYLFVQCSFNDYIYLSQLPRAATTLLQALRTAFPTTMIIVEGPHGGGATPLVQSQAVESAVQPVVASFIAAGDSNMFYLPSTNAALGVVQPWIYGTGNVTAPTGNGNADTCIAFDGIHPSGEGALQRARRIMGELFKQMANTP